MLRDNIDFIVSLNTRRGRKEKNLKVFLSVLATLRTLRLIKFSIKLLNLYEL